jgi:hypothetical protein
MSAYRSWLMDCKHQPHTIFDYCVSNKIIVLSKDCEYKNEEDHVIVA